MSFVESTSSEEYHSGSLNRVTFAESESNSQVEGAFSVDTYELNDKDVEGDGDGYLQKTDNELLMEKQQYTANYLQPTMASTLPPFTLGELDRIRDSYRTGSYWSVKKLPSKLEPGSVQLTRKQNTIENLISTSDTVFKPTSKHNSVFNPQVYVGTDYDKVKSISKSALEEEKIRIDSYSRKPFVISSRVRSKCEDIFHDPDYKFPHLGGGTGVFRLESITRSDLLNEDKFLKVDMSVKTSILVQEWLHAFYDQLSKDWPDYLFKVKFTKTDELLVQFEKPNSANMYSSLIRKWRAAQAAASCDPNAAPTSAPPAPTQLNVIFPPPNNLLNKYMHRVSTHGLAYEFGLKKRGDRWNMFEQEYIDPNASDTLPSDNLSATILPPLGSEAAADPNTTVIAAAPTAAVAANTEPQWYVPPSAEKKVLQGEITPSFLLPPPLMKPSKSVNFNDLANSATRSPTAAGAAVATPTAAASLSHGSPRGSRCDSPHHLHPSIHSQAEILHDLQPIVGSKHLDIGSLIIHLMKSSALKDMARGLVSTHVLNSQQLPAHASEQDRLDYEKEVERQRQEDNKIQFLTFSFYAPWVNKGQRLIIQKTSQKDRVRANEFGSKLRQKYRLDPATYALTKEQAAAAGGAAGAAVGDNKSDANNSGTSSPKKSAMKKSRSALQSSFDREMEAAAELEEMSFGSMSSSSSMTSRRSVGSTTGGGAGSGRKGSNGVNRSNSGAVGIAGGGAGLDSEDAEAVLKAVSSVMGEEGTAGFNGPGSSGSGMRRGMSIKKSLRSFSKSSFNADNQLIPF